MMTVHEVGQHYGVTDGFMVRALDQIGFKNAKPNTALPTDTVTLFEAKFGKKIRAKRPRTPAAARKPKPHVMRIAHSEVTAVRVSSGHIEKRLLDSPWGVHAIDAAGTRDGDPWDGEVVPGAVYFYDGSTSSGPRAACGLAHMRAVLGDEFVPTEEPSLAGQCTRCAKIVAAGKGSREPARPFGYHRSYFCETYLRVSVDGTVRVKDCSLRDDHRGQPHRARDGAEWEVGVGDYVPAPDEIGRRITAA